GAHAPRQGQRASLINYVEHQRQAATTDDTAIHHHHQRLYGELSQEDIDLRSTLHLLQDTLVIEPSGQAFAPALGLGAIRNVGGDAGQLGPLAAYDTAEECCPRAHMPGDGAGGLARIPLSESVPYGTISAEVVTHRRLLLDGLRWPEGVYTRDNLLT